MIVVTAADIDALDNIRLALDTSAHVLALPLANLLVEELVEIETLHLGFVADAQMHEGDVLQDQEQDARYDEGVGGNGCDLGELLADLDAVAVDAARVERDAVEGADGLVGEDTGPEGAEHAADAVELEHVQPVVDADPLVDVLEQGAADGGEEADDGGEPDGDVTGGGGDADKACNDALAGADDGEATLGADHVDQDPADCTGGGSGVGVEGGDHGAHGGVEGGTAVEAEPAEPDQHGAEEDEGGVVGLVVLVLAVGLSLAEDEGVGERGPAGRDVDGSSSGEVERWELVEPAVGVPGPAGDRAVDDGGPAETEDEGGDETATLEGASDHDHDGTGTEDHLVQAEDNLGDDSRSRRGCDADVLHTEVGEVTDEGVGGAREGERITPEHPLKRCSVNIC